ncbi:hypothetical protein HBE96_23120 [Clostridium sp. P21]|uniref:Uncharacterized protein n=1 Tax=Clostridium muellerianum TaxID=2716538 RepID=A0A7Y0EL46_9CLOT|nr:hypothetical protein [Clostridium muellerianum]NMM65473.1 hypothetical protein [Clostridium muellerianum]
MENKNVMILNVQAKDVINGGYIVDKTSKKDIDELYKAKKRVFRKYRGSMDYSLLTIYLQKNHKKFVKYNKNKNRLYSNNIITVNFDYSYESEDLQETKTKISELYKELRGIKKNKTNTPIIQTKKDEIANLKEHKKSSELSTQELRQKLYKDGFTLNVNDKEITYVRLYRSSGSARDGKINFVNKDYYKDIITYAMAGLEYKDKNDLDLPSIEAYISLIASSITDTFQMSPKNVLFIDDITSTFTDTVMGTELTNIIKNENGKIVKGDLKTDILETKITNKITDGEALLDKSIFLDTGLEDKAVMQIRNRHYKGTGINTDIQAFFKEHGITDISQLKGKTLAKKIEDIKLITTKSSIKYLKFNKTFEDWCKIADDTWGICKTDKGQHHNFNEMASTHYQLLNTLGMSYKEMEQFLKPTIEYIKLLKNDVTVFKLHLGLLVDGTLKEILINSDENFDTTELDDFKSDSEFILNMLKINEDFINTPICKKFREEIITNYKKNVKKGHVLINGTYATVISNPYEYLLASVGKYKNVSETLQPQQCYCKKYTEGEDILAVRSPQPTMSNVTVMENTYCKEFDTYFNFTDNVIVISSIGWNIMEQLSSLDFDGDACLITNSKLLTQKCKQLEEDKITVNGKLVKRFLVSTDFTTKSSIDRSYTPENLCDTDIKCAEGKIGECINLVQMLNSVYWDRKYKGEKEIKKGILTKEDLEEGLLELYKDISNLNVLSCIIIDSAKKESPITAKTEMDKIRQKGYLGREETKIYNKETKEWEEKEVGIRPYFFKFLNGGKKYKFNKYDTGMDYLVKIMNKGNDRKAENDKTIPLKNILVKQKINKANRKKIQRFINLVEKEREKIKAVFTKSEENAQKSDEEKYKKYKEIKDEYKQKIEEGIELTSITVYAIIKRLDKATAILEDNRKILNQKLKDTKKSGVSKEEIKDSIELLKNKFVIDNEEYITYKRIGRLILRHLHNIDSVQFLSCFIVKPNATTTIYRSKDGDIEIYGVKYKKL